MRDGVIHPDGAADIAGIAVLERVLIEQLGCSIGYRPIYALNFLCLPNIPEVGFTDRGIILTETMEIVGPLATAGV